MLHRVHTRNIMNYSTAKADTLLLTTKYSPSGDGGL